MLGDGPKHFWQSLEERDSQRGPGDEFAEELPVGPGAADTGVSVGRRGFLAMLGLSATALATACSRSPVGRIVPYLQKPEDVTPGLASYYASTCGACRASCGILLKTRDGRPIKVEGNELHPSSKGGVCAVGQASILALYDASRARNAAAGDQDIAWAQLDAEVVAGLSRARAAGREIRVVAPSDLGPTADAALGRFLAAHGARRVRWDAVDHQAIADAHFATHGVRVIPSYRLERATLVLGVDADFLGTWLSPVTLTKRYALARDPSTRKMARHIQIEPKLTLTGSNADRRVVAAPSDLVPILAALVRALPPRAGEAADAALSAALGRIPKPELPEGVVAEIAAELAATHGGAVVLCGSADVAAQALTNLLNERLGAYEATVDLGAGTVRPEGVLDFEAFWAELANGKVGAVVFWGANPVYDHPRGAELQGLLGKVEVSVSLAGRRDETAHAVKYLAPDHDPLESWGDAEPERGLVSVRQPAVSPLFETRSACESLLRWAGAPRSHYDFLRARWEAEILPHVEPRPLVFEAFWDSAVETGFVRLASSPPSSAPRSGGEGVAAALATHRASPSREGLELVLYEKVSVRDGRLANNAWLQELPDPISKVTWTNYACFSPALAAELGVEEGAMVSIRAGERAVTAPALIEPGLHRRVVALALGYGRNRAGTVGNGIGVNAFPLGLDPAGHPARRVAGVTVSRAPGQKSLAKSQTHSSMEKRPIVKEATFAEFLADPAAGNEAEPDAKRRLSMWSGHAPGAHRWGLAVDLTACTGCSACVIACQAENNIPSVGEDEVLRRREMHWMRIDRYFSGTAEEPEVVHQPMMCQHCENAPCETVCPVIATAHSTEGLNQQIYNRCVGTRYCANNCPTKVRRFNWFDYPHEDPLARMVLNPDVVVRSRGVMEKCSMCVQRIQEGKARAAAEGRGVRDGDIQTACQQSCPAGAIVFGDLQDPASKAAGLAKSARAYRVLEEINIEPGVTYLTRIRNSGTNHG